MSPLAVSEEEEQAEPVATPQEEAVAEPQAEPAAEAEPIVEPVPEEPSTAAPTEPTETTPGTTDSFLYLTVHVHQGPCAKILCESPFYVQMQHGCTDTYQKC